MFLMKGILPIGTDVDVMFDAIEAKFQMWRIVKFHRIHMKDLEV